MAKPGFCLSNIGGENKTIPYTVEIVGAPNEEIKNLLKQASGTIQGLSRPLRSLIILKQRINADLKVLTQALQSRGYLSSTVEGSYNNNSHPIKVVFYIRAGKRYRLGNLHINPHGSQTSDYTYPSWEYLKLRPGDPVVAREVLAAREKLRQHARESGFAFAENDNYLAHPNHTKQTLDLTFRMTLGPRVHLGQIELKGLTTTRADHVRRVIPWQIGERYTPQLLKKTKRVLFSSGLFRTVVIDIQKTPDQQGLYPVHITLNERKHRTISSGLRFSTDAGLSVLASWKHRNLANAGETLALEGEAGTKKRRLTADFGKPVFLNKNQKLTLISEWIDEETEVYKRNLLTADIGIERIVSPQMKHSSELSYRVVNIVEKGEVSEETFGLASLRFAMNLDHANDSLEPSSGWRTEIEGGLSLETMTDGIFYGRFRFQHSHYLSLLKRHQLILAGRAAVGALVGVKRDQLSADERFYVGGGGSLRGYGYQMAGPLDEGSAPIGGISMVEIGVELRSHIYKNIGGVLFVDAGQTFESQLPTFDRSLHIGIGAGLRYATPIGPLRFDVATPVEHRDNVDEAFQIYMSLGQAF
ncbi:autotransporter assembly complex protein TamA [Magnetococcales bacterium HHB-1]